MTIQYDINWQRVYACWMASGMTRTEFYASELFARLVPGNRLPSYALLCLRLREIKAAGQSQSSDTPATPEPEQTVKVVSLSQEQIEQAVSREHSPVREQTQTEPDNAPAQVINLAQADSSPTVADAETDADVETDADTGSHIEDAVQRWWSGHRSTSTRRVCVTTAAGDRIEFESDNPELFALQVLLCRRMPCSSI